MQATAEKPIVVPTVAGTPFGGGFFIGLIREPDGLYAYVDAGKAGDLHGKWGEYGQDIPGARSYFDGLANTRAMAEAGSELAKQALALRIGGHDDWHIPARDAQEMQYRHLKPTAEENYCTFRDGDNPSSVPVGYPYATDNPAQTTAEAYQEGGSEAFEAAWYWSSTQYSRNNAYEQYFFNGTQDYLDKDNEGRARAVRKIRISN